MILSEIIQTGGVNRKWKKENTKIKVRGIDERKYL
jgi:hypothetical protein